MPSWVPAVAYEVPAQGYWHPVTSTINWCEEDYYLTPYAAEIVNTCTNFLYLYFGYLGIQNCLRYKHDSVFLVSFAGYLLVGIGSLLFHATLKYPMQLVDELSMIYTTCLMCYATFSYARSQTVKLLLATSLIALALGITLYYHHLQDPVFHQNAFAFLTTLVVFRQVYVMEYALRPKLKDTEAKHKLRHGRSMDVSERKISLDHDIRDRKILNIMWVIIAQGLFYFLGGFAIWGLDNRYCSELRSLRRSLGLPWGIVLEGHGWWHLMTGTGAYYYITWAIWLRHCLNERQDEFVIDWPRFWHLPKVVRAGDASSSRKQINSKKET